MSLLPIQSQQFNLAGAGSSIADTTLVLSSMTTIDGVVITMSELGTLGCFTLEPGNGAQEEAGTFTGITQNANGTATLTGVKHQLFESPYTQTSGLIKSHAGGTVLVLANTAGFYEQFLNMGIANTITGTQTFVSPNYPRMDSVAGAPVDDVQLVTKKYVDDTVTFGAPDAGVATKGIVKLSSAALSSTNPVVLNSEEVSATSGVSKVVRANASGKISTGFVDQTADYSWSGTQTFVGNVIISGTTSGIFNIWGNGSDGDVTIASGTTTLTTDKYYNNLTIQTGGILKPNGFRIFVKGTLTCQGTGKIASNGGNGGNGAAGGTGTGAGGDAGVVAYAVGTLPIPLAGSAGGAGHGMTTPGADGTSGTNSVKSMVGNAVAGGAGQAGSQSAAGGAGAAGTKTGTIYNVVSNFSNAFNLYDFTGTTITQLGVSPSSGGGGGGGSNNAGSLDNKGSGGGGSGASGGVVWVSAKIIGVLNAEAIGGTGGNGGTAEADGGGGGGGNGGVIIIIKNTSTTINTTVTGGIGGTGATAGTNGTLGVVYTIIN
jgi:hypothetical protein